jgi:hypothetical protein
MGYRKQDRAGFLPRKIKDKLNAPPHGLAWCWLTQEIMESGAFRALSINGRRALDRIMIEHMRHAGQENGRLKVTWDDFVKFGISRRLVGHALGEVISAGMVAIEIPGRRIRYGQPGDPTQYRLTWLPVANKTISSPRQMTGKGLATMSMRPEKQHPQDHPKEIAMTLKPNRFQGHPQ